MALRLIYCGARQYVRRYNSSKCFSISASARVHEKKISDLNVNSDNDREHTVRKDLSSRFRQVMANVPQPVVVVTTAYNDDDNNLLCKRGVTCSSFTSVSLNPPIVSFTMNRPSRMHDLLLKTGHFAVHVLGQNQIDFGIHFSQPAQADKDQFDTIPHTMASQGNPVIDQAVSVLHCSAHSVHLVGDHNVWYGLVEDCSNKQYAEPLIYFARSYRSVSDELLMRAFESRELPFEEWTHNAHLRMAWNYIQEHGLDEAIPMIKNGIMKYNEKNRHRLERGYHETVTRFFTHMVNDAIQNTVERSTSYEEFMTNNQYLYDSRILFDYYSTKLLNSPMARQKFLPPDKQELPLNTVQV